MSQGLLTFISEKLGITSSRKTIGALEPVLDGDSQKIKRLDVMRNILLRDEEAANLLNIAAEHGYTFGYVKDKNKEVRFGLCNTQAKEIRVPDSEPVEMALIALHELVHVVQDDKNIRLVEPTLSKNIFYDYKFRKEKQAYTEQFRKAHDIFTPEELERLSHNPVYGEHIRFTVDKKLFQNRYHMEADVATLSSHIEEHLSTNPNFTARLGWYWAIMTDGKKDNALLDKTILDNSAECKRKLSMTLDGTVKYPDTTYRFTEDYSQKVRGEGENGGFDIPNQIHIEVIEPKLPERKILPLYPRQAV